MQRSVLHIDSYDTLALVPLHYQVQSEILDEIIAIVAKRLAVEGVQHAVSGTIGHGGAPVRLSALSELQRLTAESPLVDLALFGTGEGHAEVFQFYDGLRGLSGHVVYGVLIAQPIGTFDGVVHVIEPRIFFHATWGRDFI